MMLTLLQAAPPQGPPSKLGGELLWAALPLIGILLVAALVIYFVDRWRKRAAAAQEEAECSDQLSHFRSLYERGEMSQEEYDRVRLLLAGQMRKRLNVPTSPAPPAAPPETNIQAAPPGPQTPPPPGAPPP